MHSLSRGGLAVALAAALFVGVAIGVSLNRPAIAQGEKGGASAGMPRYTVVETEGVHMIVTDNQKQTTYFYTINEGEKPGADLHLRGALDLTQVGKATMHPTLLNPKKRKGDNK